jgi:hypothetical protein
MTSFSATSHSVLLRGVIISSAGEMSNGESDHRTLHTYERSNIYKLLKIKDLVEAAGVELCTIIENT